MPAPLTPAPKVCQSDCAAPHWAAGIGVLNHRAHERSYEALFLRPSRYGGCHGGSSERGSLWPYANPMASATITIGVVGGGSQLTETITMNTALVPVFAGEIAGAPVQLVDARPLHAFLEVATRFNDWIRTRIEEYGFVESQDFLVTENRATKTGRGGDRRSKEYHITLDMAKELAMVERNEKGRQVRRYFIECERRLRETKPQYALKDLRSKKALPGGLTLEQQDAIKEMVRTRAEEAPEARRGIVAVKLWSALKAKFGCPYKLIPPEHFTDALSLLARLEIEGETSPALAAPVVSPIAHHPGSAARGRERIDTLRLWANRGLPEHVRDPFLTALADIERSLTMGWTEVDEATMHIWTGLALLKRWKSHP